MNKTQLITLLVALLIAGSVVGILSGRNHWQGFVHAQTAMIGQDLITFTNSPHLVLLGPGLKDRLAQLFISPTQVEAIMIGDEHSPIGDGRATSRLILKNGKGERLGIRLKQEAAPDKFHILGYWSPETFTTR